MLPRSKRISKQLAKEIGSKSLISHGTFFIYKVIKKEGNTRFTVCISKKIEKSAVKRNKIKRRIYSIISELYSKLKDNLNIFIQVKSGTDKVLFKDLFNQTQKDFVKLGILK